MQPYIDEIFTRLRGDIFRKFVESDKYTRFCQWKNLELNIQVSIETISLSLSNPTGWERDQIRIKMSLRFPIPGSNIFHLSMSLQLTMNDFSVHRIIGRGGFGEVYGCRKADTGKMYAMKCLDKKRIKMKQGETLALNERIMLSLVSSGVSVSSPFDYWFQFLALGLTVVGLTVQYLQVEQKEADLIV